MKQVVQNFRSGDLRVVDLPRPSCRAGGVVVASRASLISSGTERTMVGLASANMVGKARQRPDLVRQVLDKVKQEGLFPTAQKVLSRLDELAPLGYSCAGQVVEVGDDVPGISIGDFVAVSGAGYANHAEFVFAPKNLVTLLPKAKDDIPVSCEAAAFTTVGAIALHGARQAAPTLGETVVVIGLGLVGQLMVQLLKVNGTRVLGSDLLPSRSELSVKLGCDAAFTDPSELAEAISDMTRGIGADAAIVTAASDSDVPIRMAADVCRDRGRVVAVGLTGLNIPRKPFYDKELDLRMSRSYGPGRYDPNYEQHGHDYPIGYVRWTEHRNMAAFVDLLSAGRVRTEELVSHRFPVDQAVTAYELITGDDAHEALGVLLTYDAAGNEARQRPEVIRISSGRRRMKLRPGVEKVVRFGIIGCGNFAKNVLLPALAKVPKARLVATCSASGLSARHVADKFGARICTSDAESLMELEDVDAVLIATRHGNHARLLESAVQYGKPVFVEKPLAISNVQLSQLRVAVESSGESPPVMVGFNRRFAPLAKQLSAFLPDDIPRVMQYTVNAGMIPSEHWVHDPRDGGGRIIGEMCHFVDFMQFISQSRIDAVYANAVLNSRLTSPDIVQAQLTFQDGSIGTISYLANGDKSFPKERFEVFAGGRIGVIDDFRTLTTVALGRIKRAKNRFGQDKGHVAELRALTDAIIEGTDSPIPWDSLIQTSLATFAIAEAVTTKTPIHLEPSSRTSEGPVESA